MRGAARAAAWLVPPLLCLTVYWPGLWAWFQQDDFAWLSLRSSIYTWSDLWRALFAPMAQGTIRPLSERIYFMALFSLFGLDALPFRAVAFLTQFANLALLASIASRLTGSRLAGLAAAVFWTANSALATAMSWSSSYNEILCAFFILLAFHFFLRHVETGQRRYYLWQWLVFLLGFGALEINVVYPALAAGYALCCARRYFPKTLPLFVPSVAYTLAHNYFAPIASTGPYAMHFDRMLPVTLWKYWIWSFGGMRLDRVIPSWPWIGMATAWLLSIALIGFLIWKLRERQWLAVVPILWFLALISPVLPLRDHFADYYLTVPTMGLAVLGGWAFASALRRVLVWRVVGVLLALLYLGTSVAVGRTVTVWNYQRSLAVQNLVLGVATIRDLHPDKVILLTDIATDLFWSAVADKPFRLLGIRDVYLAPGAEGLIQAFPELGDVGDYVLPVGTTLRVLSEGKAVVFAAGGKRLKNVTSTYRAVAQSRWKPQLARRVDVGQPLLADQLGDGWEPIQNGYRWMPRRATLRLGGPRNAGQKLHITGYCPAAQVKDGPLKMTVTVGGTVLPPVYLDRPDAKFDFDFPLAPELVGRESIEVAVEVDRVFVPSHDARELGLAFGVFSIR